MYNGIEISPVYSKLEPLFISYSLDLPSKFALGIKYTENVEIRLGDYINMRSVNE